MNIVSKFCENIVNIPNLFNLQTAASERTLSSLQKQAGVRDYRYCFLKSNRFFIGDLKRRDLEISKISPNLENFVDKY